MVAAPFLGALVYSGDWDALLGGLVFAAGLDVADGAIARAWPSQASKIGSYLDPVADKILLACVALPLAGESILPLPLVILWASRDVALVAGGFFLRASARPAGVGFFDSSHADTPAVEPSTLSKVNTAAQLVLVFWAIAARGTFGDYLPAVDGAIWHAASLGAAATTVGSAMGYWQEGVKEWARIQAKKKDATIGQKGA
jgi:cardiolipin synthase